MPLRFPYLYTMYDYEEKAESCNIVTMLSPKNIGDTNKHMWTILKEITGSQDEKHL